jgi:hypothetical protein
MPTDSTEKPGCSNSAKNQKSGGSPSPSGGVSTQEKVWTTIKAGNITFIKYDEELAKEWKRLGYLRVEF